MVLSARVKGRFFSKFIVEISESNRYSDYYPDDGKFRAFDQHKLKNMDSLVRNNYLCKFSK